MYLGKLATPDCGGLLHTIGRFVRPDILGLAWRGSTRGDRGARGEGGVHKSRKWTSSLLC